jgi:hypothetical protein
MSSILGKLIVSAVFAASVIAFDHRTLLASFLKRSLTSSFSVVDSSARWWSTVSTSAISVAFGSVTGSYSHGRVVTTSTSFCKRSSLSIRPRIVDFPDPHQPTTPTVTGSSRSRPNASSAGAAMSAKPSRSIADGLSDHSGVGGDADSEFIGWR